MKSRHVRVLLSLNGGVMPTYKGSHCIGVGKVVVQIVDEDRAGITMQVS
jgi:hypothetical protein